MGKVFHKPIIFLPVESTPRELDYKLNIARLFCQQGFDAIVGNPPFIRDELKYKNYKGIFLEKGMNPDPEYYEVLKEKGIFFYCLSDEGAVCPAFSVTYPPAVEALKKAEKIFLWGEVQKEDLIQRNGDAALNEKYVVTGYPGFDFSVSKYKEYHSFFSPLCIDHYILVNTNFGSFNGYSLEQVFESCSAMSPETRASIEKSYHGEEALFHAFALWLEKIISAYPEETFLIRPHPVERNKDIYIKRFGKFKNVKISGKGTVNQAISKAKLVIHKDCTTALQSYIAGVPVISLAKSAPYHLHAAWSLAFGGQPETVEEAKSLVGEIIANGRFNDALNQKIKEEADYLFSLRFCNIGNSTQIISEIMLSETQNAFDHMKSYTVKNSRSMIQKMKCFVRSFLPLHYKVPVATCVSLRHFAKREILSRLKFLDTLDGATVRYKITKLFPNTYLIQSKT